MKKVFIIAKMVWVILFLLQMVFSCKKDSEDDFPEGDVVDVASIGTEGGELSDEVISVEFQKDCFTQSAKMKLLNVETVDEFEEHNATDFYTITDIPANFNAPIVVTLKPDITDEGKQLYMVAGEMRFSPTIQKSIMTYEFLDAINDKGTYTFSFQPIESEFEKDQKLTLTFGLVKDYIKTSEQQKSNNSGIKYFQLISL